MANRMNDLLNAAGSSTKHELQESLQEIAQLKNELKRETFDHAPDPIFVLDGKLNIVLANLKAEALVARLNLTTAQVSVKNLISQWNSVSFDSMISGIERTKELDTEITFPNGQILPVHITLGTLELNSHKGYVLTLHDAERVNSDHRLLEQTYQDLKRDKERLEDLVKMDTLTGVLNRRGLENVLAREIEFAKRNKADLLAVMIDLDNFKRINDVYGHAVGDLVLKHVATVFKDSVRTIDWIGRVGGDEFLILLPATNLMSGVQVAERIRLDLNSKVFPLGEEEIRQTASLGIVQLPLTVCSIEEILELTKSSLKGSKTRGKNCVSFGTTTIRPVQKTVEVGVPDVLFEFSKCRTLVQPVVALRNMERVGSEMFTRGPCLEYELPDLYFKVCRDHNLLTLADLQCFSKSIQRATQEPQGGVIYLNLFPSTLAEVPAERLIEQISSIGGDREFCIELSERHIRSLPDYLIEPLAVLRKSGILIGLDDVGFGHSSLEAIFAFMPDVIKIDGRLTHKISRNKRNQLVVARLKKFADSLGSQTIAEAVECGDDARTLLRLGIEFGQGRFLGEPR